jgi:hypothetical protein
MSKYSHRTVKELKTFIKKYNAHFRIMLTGKKKADLIKEIDDGMKKTITDELKKAHADLLTKTPKPKKPKVEKPKEQPKKTMKKEDEVRPAKKPYPPIPKNIRGKRVNVKFGKPATKERIETGQINVGKLEAPKPKAQTLKVVKGKKKSIELEPTIKIKKIKVASEKKKKPKEPKKSFGIDVEKLNRKELEKQADFVGIQGVTDMSNEELKERIDKELKKQKKGQEVFCSSKIEFLLKDIKDINNTNEKYSEIAKGYGKEKLKYADYRKKFIEDANEILKNHTKYKRECTESELTEIRKGLKIMQDSPTVQKFNKRTPLKKGEEPKKAPFLEELKQTDISILEETGNFKLERRCGDLVSVSKYIIKGDKDKFKKVRIFKLSDINVDIRNVGSWKLNNPTPLAIIYNYFFQLIEDKKYLIKVKNDCGVRELLFIEKAYKILLDNFDLIKNKIIEQNKRYNPKIETIMKDRKLKDIEFNLTEKKEEPKKEEPKKEEPKKKAEPKKAEPKKAEPDAKNQKKIMSALNSLNNDITEITQVIKSNPKFNIDKATLTEKQVFKNSMFDSLNDLESAIKDFDSETFFLQNKEIKNKMDDIKDKMPFILDQIKTTKKK